MENKGMRILMVDLNKGFQANNGTRIHQVSVVVPRSIIRQKSCAKRAETDPDYAKKAPSYIII